LDRSDRRDQLTPEGGNPIYEDFDAYGHGHSKRLWPTRVQAGHELTVLPWRVSGSSLARSLSSSTDEVMEIKLSPAPQTVILQFRFMLTELYDAQ